MQALLLDALELGSLVLPPREGKAWFLPIPNVVARATTLSHFFVNLVSMARLDSELVEPTIERVAADYASRGHAFGWMVGPRSTPKDLRRHLEAHGMTLYKECAGLALTDLDAPVPVAPDVEIRAATSDDMPLFDQLKAASFEMSVEAAHWIDEMIFGVPDVKTHIAYREGKPVAFGQTFYARALGVAILGGAGTIPSERGKGVFRTLLAHRLAEAKRDGLKAATIQAFEDTSAPICTRLGFQEMGRLFLYRSA
jgi:GNAT superfamily N-acetyltransferase